MSILVTGASGFLGPTVVGRLLAHGANEVRCFVRHGSNLARLEALRARHPQAKLEYFTGNLTAAADIGRALEGITTVYHLAAAMSGGAADIFMNTVVGSERLLGALAGRRPMRVVLVSSFSVYGAAGLRRGSVINERSPLETHPEKRDPYSFAKLRQEQLFREYQQKLGFDLVVLRPGVIYGPGAQPLSGRIGLFLGSLFLHLGGGNLVPLTYVENCAEAIVVAGMNAGARDATPPGVDTYNVHDDDLPASRFLLRQYKKQVKRVHSVYIPYPLMMLLSWMLEKYNRYSKGQLPAVFTRYKTKTMWGGNRFDNAGIKSIGWKQLVSTAEGLRRTFEYWRSIEQSQQPPSATRPADSAPRAARA